MKLQKKINQQLGFTLVEMMIAVGIVGIIAIGIAKFSSNYEKGQTRAAAKDFSIKANERLLTFVERDFGFQIVGGATIKDGGLTFEITRRKTYSANDSDASYKVTYRSRCKDIPSDLDTTLGSIYTVQNRPEINNSINACFNSLACPVGKYPEIFVDVDDSDTRIPNYNPKSFPDFSTVAAKNKIRQNTAGSAMCVTRTGKNIYIVINTLYLNGTVNGKETFVVRTDEKMLTEGSIAGSGVTLLPNEGK